MPYTLYLFSELEERPLTLLPGELLRVTHEGLVALTGEGTAGRYIVCATAPIRAISGTPQATITHGYLHALTLAEGDYFSCRNECFQICDGMLVPTSRAAADVAVLETTHPDQPVVVEDMAFYGCTDIPQALAPGLVYLNQEPVPLGGYSFAVDATGPYHSHVLSVEHLPYAHLRDEGIVRNSLSASPNSDYDLNFFNHARHLLPESEPTVYRYSLNDHTIKTLITESGVWQLVMNKRPSFMTRCDDLTAEQERSKELKRDADMQRINYRHCYGCVQHSDYPLVWPQNISKQEITPTTTLFEGATLTKLLCDGTPLYEVRSPSFTEFTATLLVRSESAPLTFYPECAPYARLEDDAALYLLPEGTLVLQEDMLLHTVLVPLPF